MNGFGCLIDCFRDLLLVIYFDCCSLWLLFCWIRLIAVYRFARIVFTSRFTVLCLGFRLVGLKRCVLLALILLSFGLLLLVDVLV